MVSKVVFHSSPFVKLLVSPQRLFILPLNRLGFQLSFRIFLVVSPAFDPTIMLAPLPLRMQLHTRGNMVYSALYDSLACSFRVTRSLSYSSNARLINLGPHEVASLCLTPFVFISFILYATISHTLASCIGSCAAAIWNHTNSFPAYINRHVSPTPVHTFSRWSFTIRHSRRLRCNAHF